MAKFMTGVMYLEPEDINSDGSLKPHVGNGKPVFLMVQGNFCGYCTQAKPAFSQLAQSLPSVICATVQTDGDASDKQANSLISKVNQSPGVPAFLGFNSSGKFVGIHQGGRDLSSLQKFCSTL